MKTAPRLAFLFLAAGFTVASAQTYTFTTLAGDADDAAYDSADGSGSAARFASPNGVAVDGSGNVFVADRENHTIRKITPAGLVTTLAGTAGSSGRADGIGGVARFNTPSGVAVDGSGTVFVADRNNHTIRKITADGVVTTLAGMPGRSLYVDGTGSAAGFNSPSNVAVDGNGNVFVADSGTIRKITAGGVVTTIAGRAGPGGSADGTGNAAQFSGPTGLAVDGSGNIFVADSGNHTIRKVTPGGVVTTVAGSPPVWFSEFDFPFDRSGSDDGTDARFWYPTSVAVDDSGNVFVADTGNNTIRKIAPGPVVMTAIGPIVARGTVTTLAGSAGSVGSADGTGSGARFYSPSGVAVDGGGNLFVADRANSTIRKITAAGVVTTLAGDAGYRGNDGTGSVAHFYRPTGVAVDGSGNVIVADTNNHTIRKITAGGVVTTLAGTANAYGSADGTGSAARFGSPTGVAADASGNVFVADFGNNTIRKITAAGVVTTLAGVASGEYENGSADGTGSAAYFYAPSGVAVDGSGNLYVADLGNGTIRKITAAGVVTTLAGTPYAYGSADGMGSEARFARPSGVAVDGSGNVFVADTGNNTIRRITADGVVTTIASAVVTPYGTGNTPEYSAFRFGVAVDGSGNVFVTDRENNTIRKITSDGGRTTLAGLTGSSGSANGTGSAARFSSPTGVAVDSSGNLYIADTLNNTIRKGVPAVFASVARTAPQSQHVAIGGGATFRVVPTSSGVGFQWKKDGVAIAGATGDTYEISRTAGSDMGFYSVVVTGAVVPLESPVAILTVVTGGTSRLSNFSVRGLVPAGGDLTTGFVLRGSGDKSVLVRAVGPTLGSFGVSGALADPKLDVLPAGGPLATTSNDDWGGGAALANAFASVGAFPLASASKDAALLATLPVAGYTARITSSLAGGSGSALAEVYDRDPAGAASRLGNISTLGFVGADAQAPALGFVIDGAAPKRLLIRAVGPGLQPLAVAGVLDDPQLSVIPLGKTFTIASNDNWGGDATLASAFISAGAFALPPSSKDAVMIVHLPPGGYTVTVSGVAFTSGRALVEIYDLDP